jgi:phosphate transport system substrate-binding protein
MKRNYQAITQLKNAPMALAIVLAVLLITVACGGSSSQVTDPGYQNPAKAPTGETGSTRDIVKDLSGTIEIDGSSTVFPISEAAAEEFGLLSGGNVRILVGISGTGGGFKKFCSGETDIANASRPIKAQEVVACAENGIQFIELPVAIDGLSVTVNPENNFVSCITLDELNIMWSPDAEGRIKKWDQVRPGWPSTTLSLYGPGADSGTFDYFTEVVNGESQSSRGDFIASENDNVLVQGISGDRDALGYFGYSYYIENQDKLKLVGVDAGQGCVLPTPETIADGTYAPFARPLFMYVNAEAALQTHVRAFVRYFLGEEGAALVREVGYIAFPTETAKLSENRVNSSSTGTLFGGETPKSGPVHQILEAYP